MSVGSVLYPARGRVTRSRKSRIVLLSGDSRGLSRWWRRARRNTMAWFRVRLTEDQQRIVNEERVAHPSLRVREKMLVLWLLHCGATREKAAQIAGVSRATVQRYVAAFRAGGLEGLRQHNHHRPLSEMAAYRELIYASFEKQPARTVAEACERIYQLTGLRRGPSQVRKFLKDLGVKFQRVRMIPVPPKKTWPSTSQSKRLFSTPN